MYTYKIFNNIATQGINCLKDNGFKENENDPDALIIRSHGLVEKDFNPSLKCICRAGAGVNHIPLSLSLIHI